LSLNSIFLRCFVDTYGAEYDYDGVVSKSNDLIHLVIDVNTDKKLNLIYGTSILLINKIQYKTYVFYNDDAKSSDIAKIKASCDSSIEILSRKEFVENVFVPYVLRARAKCIGFSLPFILSRMATDVTYSTRQPNGFSFTISEKAKIPDLIIKSNDSKSQFIEFTKTFRKKRKTPYYRGCFVDCKTLGFVLTNNSYLRDSILADFDCPKYIPLNKTISKDNIQSSITNVMTIYSLYNQLMKRYEIFCIKKLENKLFSPASIGISYLEKIGIKPFLKQNPDFCKKILGIVMSAYFGARVEARRINIPTLVTILDFASMYPTLFVLFGMYSLLIAEKISYHTTTESTQEFLDKITINQINKPETWKNMLTMCKIVPDNEILPVRSDYSKNILNVGLNHLKSKDGTELYYALPDLIASKLLTGKISKIIEAITFFPQGVQSGLKDIEILPGINLKKGEDLFKKLIEERFAIKKQKQTKESDQLQKILKIIANSTCYGKFIQLDTRNTILEKKVTVYGLDTFDTETFKIENPAKFFHPIISVFLTAGSRLILAAAEYLLEQNKGYMMYCDTDSVFVSPDHAKLIQDFFRPLNPYSEKMEMFKVQEDGKKLENVMCLAISSKRYAVYEYENDTITILKYSNHALGHYLGINHKQFWHNIILLWYHPEKEDEIVSKYDTSYAMSELTISHYSFLERFDGVNYGKKYSQKIKPYDTVLVGTACRKDSTGMPIIPFVPKIDQYDEIPFMPFVDKSGIQYPNSDSLDSSEYWKKMSEVFSEYRNHRETKLDSFDCVVQRKHLVFGKESIKYVGKEIHDLEESMIFGASKNDSIMYENEQERLRRIAENLTLEKALRIGISRRVYFDWKKKIREGKSLVFKNKSAETLFSEYLQKNR
jgi:hypothetical protein